MQVILRQITLFFMVGVFLVTSIGFTVYESYCNCLHKTTESLFTAILDDCHTSAHQESCCSEEHERCPLQQDDCHDTKMEYVKINTSYVLQETEKINPNLLILFYSLLSSPEDNSTNSQINTSIVRRTIPPPLFGKALLCFTHQLKLDILS